MKFYLLFLLIGIRMVAYSSDIDSLKKAYDMATSDQQKLTILKDLNLKLISTSNLDSSLHYFEDMALISERLQNDTTQCIAYRYMCEAFMHMNDLENARLIMDKSMIINQDNTSQYVLDANQIGRAYHYFYQDSMAIKFYELGAKKYLENPSGKSICLLLSNLATSYESIGEKEKGLDLILLSAHCAECTNDERWINQSYYTLGYNYMDIGDYQKAEDYFFKCLADSNHHILKTYVNRNYHALGINYSRWGKYEKALSYNQLALKHFMNTGDILYQFDVLNNISAVYLNKGDFDSSLHYASNAYELASLTEHPLAELGARISLMDSYIGLNDMENARIQLNWILQQSKFEIFLNNHDIASVYNSASKIEEFDKNYKLSLKYLNKSKILNEGVLTSNRNLRFYDKENKYQAEKKERIILEERLKNSHLTQEKISAENNAFNIKLVSILVLIITAVIIYLFYSRNKRRKQIMYENQKELLIEKGIQIAEGKRQERQRLQNQLHTDIKNSLSNIKDGLQTLIPGGTEEYKYIEELGRIMEKTRNLSHSMELANHQAELHLSGFIQNLVDESTTPYRPISFYSDARIKKLNLSTKALLNLYYIVKEGIANARSHGKPDKIDISLNSNENNITLLIVDDGAGIPADSRDGFGVRSLKRIVRDLKGTLKYKSEQGIGTTLKVEIPLKQVLK